MGLHRDNHHLAHYEKEWSLRPEGLYIREQLIARGMSRVVHNLLHKDLPPVPVPSVHSLHQIARGMHQGLDVYQSIDEFCLAAQAANRSPHIKPYEIELNWLSINGIRAQIPYLQDGLPNTTRIIA